MAAMTFKAPWGGMLTGMTLFSTIILLGIPLFSITRGIATTVPIGLVMIGLPLAIYIGGALYTIRGYEIHNSKLIIKRLLWTNEIELRKVKDVQVNPEAMSSSIRTFGNGGLFSFSGRFRNKLLGPYQAFATKPRNAVILKTDEGTVVVTPDKPEQFADAIKQRASIL